MSQVIPINTDHRSSATQRLLVLEKQLEMSLVDAEEMDEEFIAHLIRMVLFEIADRREEKARARRVKEPVR